MDIYVFEICCLLTAFTDFLSIVHTYIMVAATDHESWILLVRCKIGVQVNQPGEGMSWAILSKSSNLHNDTANVIFGLLEGYGFDLRSFKFDYSYDSC